MSRLPIRSVLVLLLAAGCSQKPPIAKAGDLDLLTAYAHPSAGDAGAAYFTLRNTGSLADTLVSATGPDSSSAMLMATTGGRMSMAAAMPIKAGETVAMIPGAMHVMFSGLTHEYLIGDTLRLTLHFARAGDLKVAAPVLPYGEMPE